MDQNWKQIWAKKQHSLERIKTICPNIKHCSGIYVFYREEKGIRFAYIGQSLDIWKRCADHLLGYQHIDNSLKKHGLYDKLKNPNGYQLSFTEYPKEMLDSAEQETIKFFANRGFQLKNKTSGSQGVGKTSIEEHSTKGYRQGVAYGYEKCRKEVKEYFDKYLVFETPKFKADAYKKNGELKEIYTRKFNEFAEWLKGESELL